MFQKARADHESTGVMDYRRHDWSLHRYVEVAILSAEEAAALAEGRQSSGWPILEFEEEVYGNLDSLLAAYKPVAEGRVTPAKAWVDLEGHSGAITITLRARYSAT